MSFIINYNSAQIKLQIERGQSKFPDLISANFKFVLIGKKKVFRKIKSIGHCLKGLELLQPSRNLGKSFSFSGKSK
jgi:hypothetical protein